MPFRSILSIHLLIFFTTELAAQTANIDSMLAKQMQEAVISKYYLSIKENAPFLSGAEYTGYGQGLNGHAFFESESSWQGWLEYDGVIYKNITLQYDLIQDAIIVKDFTQNYLIKLNSKKIGSFALDKNVFVQPAFYQKEENFPLPGFFQQLYKGSTTPFVKRRKQIVYKATEEKTIGRFVQYNSYYIKKGTDFHLIKSKNDIARVYGDKKIEIKKYISENRFSFRKQPEEMLAKIAAYYDQIKN